jgi:hypothetical protein
MLSIHPDAAAYIRGQNKSIYLEIQPPVSTCCIHMQDAPIVRFGEPKYFSEEYEKRIIDGITVFVPYELPDHPLRVVVHSYFGFKNLTVSGWHLA